MKCVSCKTSVPPNFAAAISNNRCPACGHKIMEKEEFNKLLNVKGLLKRLEFDDKQLTKVAAAITSKYDLVLKGSAKTDLNAEAVEEPEIAEAEVDWETGEVSGGKLPPLTSGTDYLDEPLPGEGGGPLTLTAEEKEKLRQVKPDPGVVDFMSSLVQGAMPKEIPDEEYAASDPESFDRLQRAQALKENMESKIVRRD